MEANVVISPDTLRSSYKEVEDVVAEYFDQTIASQGLPPLDFNWQSYLSLEQQGFMMLISARDDNDYMIGFVLYMVAPHPHHRTNLVALCDMIGVRPAYRHQGVGDALMQVAEQHMREVGVHRIIHMYRETYGDTVPLFERRGYVQFERAYMKDLSSQRQAASAED